jgi:hypothetical protein
MAMAPCSTFDYVATVPEHPEAGVFACRAAVRESIVDTGSDIYDARLVGMEPDVRVSDAGLTPDASPDRPLVLRSRITLAASARKRATEAEASFHVDKDLASCVRAGDEVHLVFTGSRQLGLSILRGGELVVAVGVLTTVALGRSVTARIPTEMIDEAEAVFRRVDSEFTLPVRPVELAVNGARAILDSGRRSLGEWEVFVLHGEVDGIPGTAAFGAIWRRGRCPVIAAQATAMLMNAPDALTISDWGGAKQ